MKTRVLIMAMMVAFVSFVDVQAQNFKRGDKIEFRVKRMAGKLKLDESQKEKFTTLYKDYLDAKAECRPQLVWGNDLTDEQIKANMEEAMSVREKSLKIDKKYYKKLSKVLDAKQLDLIFGFDAQMGKRSMAPGKDMDAFRFGKPGAPKGKGYMPKGGKKGGDRRKAHGFKVKTDCKRPVDCKHMDAVCGSGKEYNMKADCKEECKKGRKK